jgi:hypothetical protein
MSRLGLTPRLQGLFRPLVLKAWLAHCERDAALDPMDVEAEARWYRSVLMDRFGFDSTKAIDPANVKQVDELFQAFAQISGDEQEIDYWSRCEERRMLYLIRKSLERISELEHFTADWKYVRAMWAHMNLPLTPDEAPAEILHTLFQALDTHVRRLEEARKAAVHRRCA